MLFYSCVFFFFFFFLFFFSVFWALRLPRVGKRELILVLLVRLFDLRLFNFCLFTRPLGVWEGLRFVIVALPGLLFYLLFISDVCLMKINIHLISDKKKKRLFKSVWVGRSVLRLNDGSLSNRFQLVVTWLSMSVVGLIVVLFVVFLCSGFRSTVYLNICVSLRCLTDELEDPYADRSYICNLELDQN